MAIRISTGAAVPEGADTVVIQEDVRRDGDQYRLRPRNRGKISVRAAAISPPARFCYGGPQA